MSECTHTVDLSIIDATEGIDLDILDSAYYAEAARVAGEQNRRLSERLDPAEPLYEALPGTVSRTIEDFDDIRTAIEGKGVVVPADTPTSLYADRIGDILSGEEAYEVGRQSVIDGQSDATISPGTVFHGVIGYGANNTRIVGEFNPTDVYNEGFAAGEAHAIDGQSDGNITPEDVRAGKVGYAADNARIVGVARLTLPQRPAGMLAVYFVSPAEGDGLFDVRYIAPGGNIDALPEAPDHTADGLRFVGYNWTLADLRNVQSDIVVGAMYETISGDLEIDIELLSGGEVSTTFGTTNSNVSVGITWEQGAPEELFPLGSSSTQTHVYATGGPKRITVKYYGADTSSYLLSTGNRSVITTEVVKRLRCPGANVRLGNYTLRGQYKCVEAILPQAFSNNVNGFQYALAENNIRCIVLPSTHTRVSGNMFRSSLCRYLSLPPTITVMDGAYAMRDMPCLEHALRMPDAPSYPLNVASGNMAPEVIIPASVTSIGDQAFADMYCCNSVVCLAPVPPALTGSNVFRALPVLAPIYVPDGAVNAYKSNWPDLADRIRPISERVN